MDMFHLRGLSETAQQLSSNHTIYFGHYPTSTMLAPAGLYDVLRWVKVYSNNEKCKVEHDKK